MEKLDIVAKGSHSIAYEGNSDPIAISVCVTKTDGTPVTGLTKTNFNVRMIAGGLPHSSNKVSVFIDDSVPDPKFIGFYTFFVPLEKGQVWAIGEYIFAVRVKLSKGVKTPLEGRTLAKLTVPYIS
jgi:hypothetical protein